MGRRKAKGSREPADEDEAAADDAPRGRGKSKSSERKRGGPRSRLLHWPAVPGVWVVIAGIAAIAFVASTLPPIQSLEVPKRPPTVEIVGIDGRSLVSRGEMSGTDVPIKELPPFLPRAFVAIE